MRSALILLGLVWLPVASGGRCLAEDHFLTIGGGYHPEGNQVSLEKNVLLFSRLLEELYPQDVVHDVYFADGDDPNRDVQFIDPREQVSRAHRLLAVLFDSDDEDLAYQYRNHEIPQLEGAANRSNIDAWFADVAAGLADGDRLFIYSTAHGGRASDKERPHDTALYLWNRQRLAVTEFASLLDAVPPDVPVVLVMVQCFSGGFAHTIFAGGEADEGLSESNRCGFFATVHDRVAAGCTPDIDEADYREYSTYFFEALRGLTRYDEPIARPDYDGDGRTSLAEAHAYTVLMSDTIDIPVRTSDALLREFSRTSLDEEDSADSASEETEPVSTATQDAATVDFGSPDSPELLTRESDYDILAAHADVVERAIIDGLSAQLGLTESNRAAAARALAEDLRNKRNELNEERNRLRGEFNRLRGSIKRRVVTRWPEMNNRWHPVTTAVLTDQAEELVSLIESHPRFGRMEQVQARLDEIDTIRRDHDRQWAKCQRLLRTLETVALAANLPHVAEDEIVERFERLRAAESATLGSP